MEVFPRNTGRLWEAGPGQKGGQAGGETRASPKHGGCGSILWGALGNSVGHPSGHLIRVEWGMAGVLVPLCLSVTG